MLFTLLLASQRVFWRDEVRAFSLALGDDVIDSCADCVVKASGASVPDVEGIHALNASPAVLPVVSLRRPQPCWRSNHRSAGSVVAAFLLGRAELFEYAVMARNHGISMLLMFAFASCTDTIAIEASSSCSGKTNRRTCCRTHESAGSSGSAWKMHSRRSLAAKQDKAVTIIPGDGDSADWRLASEGVGWNVSIVYPAAKVTSRVRNKAGMMRSPPTAGRYAASG